MTLLDRARDFATRAHAGQKRKYTGYEYVTHCEAVVSILRGADRGPDAAVATHWQPIPEGPE